MYKFYCDSPLIEGQTIVLSPEESKHAIAVLRLPAGTEILIVNGKGAVANANIKAAHKTNCETNITTVSRLKNQGEFTLLISPPKSTDRWEYIIEKAQELNVSCIQPVVTYHSERKKINLEKAQKISRAALKQCGAFFECTVSDPISFSQALKQCEPGLFGYCKMLNEDKVETQVKSVFIGPEGDFSDHEAEQLIAAGWKTMRLANNILRSETAAITAIVKHNPFI